MAGDGLQSFLVNLLNVNQIEDSHFQPDLSDDQIYLVRVKLSPLKFK